jgi:hypothetical protein
MTFAYEKYNTAFNQFLDDVNDFRYGFVHTQQSFKSIARAIINIFVSKAHLDIEDPEHPFNRYGYEEYDRNDIIKIINEDVLSHFGGTCANATAFFHSGGSCRDDFEQLLDAFFDWIDASYTDDESYEISPNDADSDSLIGDPN